MAVIIDPRIGQRQSLVDSIDFVKNQIEITQRQLASAENSTLFTAAEKAPRVAALKAELAGQQARLASEQQALQQFDSGTTGATDAPAAATTSAAASS